LAKGYTLRRYRVFGAIDSGIVAANNARLEQNKVSIRKFNRFLNIARGYFSIDIRDYLARETHPPEAAAIPDCAMPRWATRSLAILGAGVRARPNYAAFTEPNAPRR
jgi:hypothetical protein